MSDFTYEKIRTYDFKLKRYDYPDHVPAEPEEGEQNIMDRSELKRYSHLIKHYDAATYTGSDWRFEHA